jgi:hypothetical protein
MRRRKDFTMQYLMFVMILSVTAVTYLTEIHVAPALFRYLPEVLSGLVAAYVVVAGPSTRFRLVAGRYWLVFVSLAIVIGCGVLSNAVSPGPLTQGCRFYLRALPLFFLPAVFQFSDSNIRSQLRLLLGIALLQLPVSIYQRYTVFAAGRNSGDPVFGTLLISSIMSIFLICCICVAAGMTLRGRMSKITFFVLFVLLVVPTTINETKGTLFLLPIGLLVTLIVGSPPRKRLSVGISAITLLLVFGFLFVPIYDYFSVRNNPYPYTVESFFSNKKLVRHYLDPGTDLGSRREAGRIDSLVVPLQTLSSDPVKLMLGVGIGNGSGSSLGNVYTGAYYELLGRYTNQSSAADFIVEIGLLGITLVLLLYWLIFRDAFAVAMQDSSIVGAVALGWLGTTAVITVATFYKTIHYFESLSYLFWYFSGLIAAQRMRLALDRQPLAGEKPLRRVDFMGKRHFRSRKRITAPK